jgi:hypothetical protein
MAREAIARLYDVDKNSIVYTKPDVRGKYDHGTIGFRAKDGKLVDLDKIHESVWATRLSGGTRSALVNLEVTVAGNVVVDDGVANLIVPGAKESFVLAGDPDEKVNDGESTKYAQLLAAVQRGSKVQTVTGRLEGWTGHWPKFLNQPPPKVKRIFVTGFQVRSASE